MVQWVKGLVLLQWRGCYCGVGSIPGSGTPACCELKKKKKKKKSLGERESKYTYSREGGHLNLASA